MFQCLVDFVAELTLVTLGDQETWTLHIDGSSNPKRGGAGIILEGPNGILVKQSLKLDFQATNNQAEYEALLAGLRLAHDIGARNIYCNSDSKLMVAQLAGNYQIKDPLLQRYHLTTSAWTSCFPSFTIHHVPRERNARADRLSKLANTKRPG
uniref:Uncharacterized protein Mb2253c family n=1 Tax=Cajanus cajan TaxID=3821 RepID=A0A151QP70_CAJCA|nr:Uncharacterized protein Mb2253c family [Cajanus cajan]